MDSRGKISWQTYFNYLSASQRETVKSTMARLPSVKKYLATRKYLSVEGLVAALYEDYLAVKTDVSAYGQGDERSKAAQFKIQSILQADPSFSMNASSVYLDVGSGDGVLATELASKYGVQDYVLTDVQNYLSAAVNSIVGDRFMLLEPGAALLPGNSVVSSFQVLHHAGSLSVELRSLATALLPGGKLLLSEHDVCNSSWHNLILLEHIAFEIAEIPRGKSLEEFQEWFEQYDLKLTSFVDLSRELAGLGFRLMGKTAPTRKNATYYSVYVKETEEMFLRTRDPATALRLYEAVDFTYNDGQPLTTSVRLYPAIAKRYIRSEEFPVYMDDGGRVSALVTELFHMSSHASTMEVAVDLMTDVILNDVRQTQLSAAYMRSFRQAVADGNIAFARVVYRNVPYSPDLLAEAFHGVDITALRDAQ